MINPNLTSPAREKHPCPSKTFPKKPNKKLIIIIITIIKKMKSKKTFVVKAHALLLNMFTYKTLFYSYFIELGNKTLFACIISSISLTVVP